MPPLVAAPGWVRFFPDTLGERATGGLVGRFEKTDTARQEIAARMEALDRRALLIMVGGQTSAEDIGARARQLGLEAKGLSLTSCARG